jgi:hypothetical protein
MSVLSMFVREAHKFHKGEQNDQEIILVGLPDT